VLGGSFAEGIDLAGTRLIGAFIATLGLPQFNAVNEELRRRLDREFGAGYDYTYLFPGIRKVVQAAGRVIRTPSDRGVLHLIDDRFAKPEVLRLLPTWWHIESDATRPAHGRSATAATHSVTWSGDVSSHRRPAMTAPAQPHGPEMGRGLGVVAG
jgi:DNA excision repair protein ERCC-2